MQVAAASNLRGQTALKNRGDGRHKGKQLLCWMVDGKIILKIPNSVTKTVMD